MTATELGAFCHSCSKEVLDFSAMTDSELLSFFAGGKAGCGRFRTDQVGMPITPPVLHNGPMRWWAMFFSLLPFLYLRAAAAPDQYRQDLTATNVTVHPQPLATHTTPLALITEVEREPIETDTTVFLPEVTVSKSHPTRNYIMGEIAIESTQLAPLPAPTHHRGYNTQFLSPKKERKHWLRRFLRLE